MCFIPFLSGLLLRSCSAIALKGPKPEAPIWEGPIEFWTLSYVASSLRHLDYENALDFGVSRTCQWLRQLFFAGVIAILPRTELAMELLLEG